MHRLLCIYSLVKPPRNSNVTGGENLKNLLAVDEALVGCENERKDEINELLDEIVTNGECNMFKKHKSIIIFAPLNTRLNVIAR